MVKWSSVLKTNTVWRCVVRVGLVSPRFGASKKKLGSGEAFV